MSALPFRMNALSFRAKWLWLLVFRVFRLFSAARARARKVGAIHQCDFLSIEIRRNVRNTSNHKDLGRTQARNWRNHKWPA